MTAMYTTTGCTYESTASTSDVADKTNQTPSALSLKSPRKTLLKKKIHSLWVLVRRRKKRLEIVKCHLFHLKKVTLFEDVVVNTVESIVKAASSLLSADCLNLLEVQLRLAKHCPGGRMYSNFAKHFSLNLYSHGSKAYRFLSSVHIYTAEQIDTFTLVAVYASLARC